MKTIKIARGKAMKIYDVLAGPQGQFGQANRKFVYALMKNIDLLEREVKLFNRQKQDYDQKRIDLLKQFGDKDERGEAILVQNAYDSSLFDYQLTPENRALFDVEFKKLTEEYGIEGMLEDEIELEVYPIDYATVPETLTLIQMQMLDPLLENTDGPQQP